MEAKWGVNKGGVKYYNDLTNELIANGLKWVPFILFIHHMLFDMYGVLKLFFWADVETFIPLFH